MKYSSFLASVLAAVCLTACGKESAEPDNNNVMKSERTVLNAIFESFGTKTSLSGNDVAGYDVLWTEGDEITIADEYGSRYVFRLDKSSAGKKNGVFIGSENLPDGDYSAWYGTDGINWPTELPYESGKISGSPMRASFSISKGVAEPLYFRNLGGLLRISLDAGFSVRRITLSSDIPMTGEMTVSAVSDVAPKAAIDTRGIIYASLYDNGETPLCSSSETVFHLPLPENSYPGFRVTVFDKDGNRYVKYIKNGRSLKIERNAITPVTLSGFVQYHLMEDGQVLSKQTDYLSSLSLSSGALLKDTGSDIVCPYFSNLAAMAMAEHDKDYSLKYVRWYLDHLNGNGTICDYQTDGETSRGSYDSKDSYAATFLILIEKLIDKGFQYELTKMLDSSGVRDKIADVAAAMLSCMDTDTAAVAGHYSPENDDFLSVAKPDYDVKYLMDNCEVNRALKAAVKLQDAGFLPEGTDYNDLLAKNTAGIETHLWSESNGMYDWCESNVSGISRWDNFYPDAVAQMWPLIFGVLETDDPRARNLYGCFVAHYPSWVGRHGYDTYHWAAICYAAALMGDCESVETFIEYLWGANATGNQKPWWYCTEAAWTIMAIQNTDL